MANNPSHSRTLIICIATFVLLGLIPQATQAGLPRVSRIVPPGGQRGTTIEVVFQGRYLEKPEEVMVYEPGITVESFVLLEEPIEIRGRRNRIEPGSGIRVKLKIAEDCELGVHGMRLRTATGISEYQRFLVGPFPTVEEAEQPREARNDSRDMAQTVTLNNSVLGRMLEPTDVDYFKIEAKQGQRLSAEIEAVRLGVDQGIPDLHVSLLDADGKRLISADDSALFLQDPVVSIIAPKDGAYFIEVRHSTYSANNDVYRLHIGTFVRPTGLYPAGGPAGKELSVRVLGDPKSVFSQTVKLPENAQAMSSTDYRFVALDPETKVPSPTPNTLRVSPFENVLESEPNDSEDAIKSQSATSLPIALNGIIEKSGDVDCFRFNAKKGERFRVYCLANAIGSPLDPTIWIKQVGARGNPQRATDSRPNQLGYPPFGGMNRDTLDAFLEFAAPADGEYVLGVEDDRGNGGADFVYRVEISPESDAVYVYIPQDGEAAFQPQSRQSISVPSGGRYNTQLSVINSNRPFNGDLELVALGLPEGVTMHAPRVTPAMPRVPVVFEAAPDAKLQGKFIEIVARPAVDAPKPTGDSTTPAGDSTTPAGDSTKPAGSETAAASERKLVSGFRQSIPMSSANNNDYYLFNTFEKLAIAVTEPAPFSIEIEEPKSALVQNGEMSLKFKVIRAAGFDEPVSVAMEWKPNGVSTGTPTTIRSDKPEGEYLLGAARNATAGTYQVTLSAVSGAQRPAYRDGANRTYVSTKPFKLLVAEPHIDAKFARASIERGKTANLVIKLNHLKPFEGKAKATLSRLPRGIVLVEPFREIAPGDKEVTFTLKATDECLTGGYQGITLDLTVTEEGQAVRQLSGFGTLRIDAERGVKAAMK